MCRKLGNHWVEYMDPIDFMDRPSNMEIGLWWYKKGANKKWTYDLTDHLLVNLETIITLASMGYVVDAYELLLRVEQDSSDFINEMLGFSIIHMIGVHYHSNLYMCTYITDYI